MDNHNFKKGISLYMAVVVLAILLGISLGLSTLIVTKIKIIRGMEESVVAFYAADTGIERALIDRLDPTGLDGQTAILDLGGGQQASYELEVSPSGAANCNPASALNYCIKSIGTYKNTKRAVEVRY